MVMLCLVVFVNITYKEIEINTMIYELVMHRDHPFLRYFDPPPPPVRTCPHSPDPPCPSGHI